MHYPITPSEESIEEFKRIYKKEFKKDITDEDARETVTNLLNYADLLIEMALDEKQREDRLKSEPNGYAFSGEGRTCHVCGQTCSDQDMWYDKWGMKCLNCQEALNKKIIPGYVFKDYDNKHHITASTLSWKCNIRSVTIRRLVRQGKLKARVILTSNTMIFLRKENPDLGLIITTEIRAKSNS